jgi:hypothetical protein
MLYDDKDPLCQAFIDVLTIQLPDGTLPVCKDFGKDQHEINLYTEKMAKSQTVITVFSEYFMENEFHRYIARSVFLKKFYKQLISVCLPGGYKPYNIECILDVIFEEEWRTYEDKWSKIIGAIKDKSGNIVILHKL